MKSCVVFCIIWLFIYLEQTESSISRDRRVRDRAGSGNETEEPDYHPIMTEIFGLEDKKKTDYRFGEREVEEEYDPSFDPSVVIVDKNAGQSPSITESNWPTKGLFDDIFGRMPGFWIEETKKPWWKGDNVCVERKEVTEGAPTNKSFIFSFVHSSCEEADGTYICTKRVRNNEENKSYIEKRQCCYGYKLNGNKCEELELKGLVPTMENLGASRFVKMLASVDLIDGLNTDNNITVFCPIDDAVTDFEDDEENNKIPQGRVVRETMVEKIASGHLVNGYLRSGDLANNQLLQSTNGETNIRVNLYSGFSGRILTANCAKIIKADNFATNGVVHLMESMLPLPSKTVADIVSSNPELSILKGLLSQANLVQTLRDVNGNFTVFAPTDSAFKNGKIDELLLQKLQDGKACVTSVVKNHIIPYVVCTSAISVAAQVRNLIDEKLILKRSDDDKLFVDKAQVISHDIVGTNGVVHIIDEVLMPEEAQTLAQALESADMNDLISFIEAADMKEEIDSMKNFTFFAPRPSAIKEVMQDELQKGTENVRNIVNFHLIPRKVKSCEFHNNQLLPTSIENATLRVNKYEIFPGIASKVTIQCAPLISDNNDVCEGTVHYIDRVLVPTKSSLFETLKEMADVSKFVNLLHETGLAETLSEEGPFTVLAPTNEAFGKMHNKHILDDREKLTNLLKMHILPEMLCCSGVGHGSGLFFRQYVTTLEGSNYGIRRAHHGVRFSNARTLECDHVATNGVIHTLSKVIEPRRQRPLFVSLSDFFDM